MMMICCFVGNCFGEDGIDEIRKILENQSFVNEMIFSDDEGSDQEGEEEYGEEGDNDEDYEDYEDEDEEEEDTESPSFFFGNNPIQQKAWNNFQTNQQQSGADLSSFMSSLNVCSPFSFGRTDVNIHSLDLQSSIFSSRPMKINGLH